MLISNSPVDNSIFCETFLFTLSHVVAFISPFYQKIIAEFGKLFRLGCLEDRILLSLLSEFLKPEIIVHEFFKSLQSR